MGMEIQNRDPQDGNGYETVHGADPVEYEAVHGGDRMGYELEYGRKPLDFSASISPLGLPECVKRAVIEGMEENSFYPDPYCRILREKLAVHLGIPAEWILCGNGASDLIYRLACGKRPRKAVVPVPTFTEYEKALTLSGCRVLRFPLPMEHDFLVTGEWMDELISWMDPEVDLIFLCQPNNPTGWSIPKEQMLRLLKHCRHRNILLAVDECFLDFLDTPHKHTMLSCLAEGSLLLLRAFTKFYGMAGLRLGYCLCADSSLLSRMREAGPPWNVSQAAQTAGIAALEDPGYEACVRRIIRTERERMRTAFNKLGVRVIPGEANFLLIHAREDLGEVLKRQGILIRDCRNIPGLEPGWFRIAIRTAEENDRLLEALHTIC